MSTERLFLAIPVEDRLRDRLRELQEISLETLADHGIANVRAENLRNSHITIRFLGDVENAQKLVEALDGVTLSTGSFEYCVSSIGVFDSPRKARVLWAGLDQLDRFRALRSEVDARLSKYDFAKEQKPYSPHLTLARFREPQDLTQCIDELQHLTDVCTIERYAVKEVVLYSSKLSPQGATHTKRALLKLTEYVT
ncbi:MAG TPA: RNA 2',3'-cyclic phosphodiesterase [Candidatus Kapabacteria bacterium]|nr:RNA 2',3'-cyclic phosphodiesterase [Candidatus Kapabacteria bacterium]